MKIIKCMTNHMLNPIGFAMEHAVVSWTAESSKSKKQTRAHIVVALDQNMQEVIYASDPFTSPDSTGVKLPIKLKPRTAYYWTVQVWGDAGDTAISEVNYFETGKMGEALGGEWITIPWEDKNISPYVRKQFNVNQQIRKARLYITGLGLYLPEINGQRASNDYLAPGCTAADRWVQIYTYDVTTLLKEGENVLGVLLGNGWAKGWYGCNPTHHHPYVDKFLLKAELHLELADGSKQLLVTDNTWKCTPSPILEDSIYNGEVFDENKVIADWSCPGLNEDNWEQMVTATAEELGNLEDRFSPPIVVKETMSPAKLIRTPAGELVLDMGQNMTGWLKIRVHEPAGTRITLTHGEILQNDCFYKDNLRKARAEFVYISNGTEMVVEPHFTFYGFRYVKLEGFSESVNINDFTGCVVYSDLEETGWINTSDPRINRLYLNAKWSHKDNFLDVPTDCPQRDERMGWTGDAQVFCKSACYNMDTYAFYTKFLHDLWKEQEKNFGMVPHVVPSMKRTVDKESSFWGGGGCVWGDASTIMPWTMYQHYGDAAILEQQYPSMKAWVDWIDRTYVDQNGLWGESFQFGDWLALDAKDEENRYGGTDKRYIASAYLKYSSELVAKAATVLQYDADAAHYQRISERTKAAIQKHYFAEDGTCSVKTQTGHILALQLDLVEPCMRAKVAEGLIELLRKSDMHLQTGFVGTPFLCKVLSAEGYSKEAYEILFQKDFPSWLYEVDMGATTIWERWNSVLPNGMISSTGMNSLNHYAYGSVVQWMYENMCGLTLKDIGYKSFYVRPEFSERFAFVEMKYNSPKGTIEIKWEKAPDDKYSLYVKVPFDTTAIVQLSGEGNKEYVLAAGEHYL